MYKRYSNLTTANKNIIILVAGIHFVSTKQESKPGDIFGNTLQIRIHDFMRM